MLGSHREQDLLERIRVIVDEGQHATKPIHKVVEEAAIDIRFDAVDEEGEPARQGGKILGADSWGDENVSQGGLQAQVEIEIRTICDPLSPALPNLLGRVALANDRILLTVETPARARKKQQTVRTGPIVPQKGRDFTYAGLVSSHFFFRRRQVIQPVLDRPLVTLS